MSVGIDKLASELQKVIEEKDKNKKTPYDTEAKVVRVDTEVVWVKIPGGVDETPVQKTVNAKVGDIVQVRVSGGRAFLVGNGTNPPTDDTQANIATEAAQNADRKAADAIDNAYIAKIAAEKAVSDAETAHIAALQASEDAERAETAANTAQTSADNAARSAVVANQNAQSAIASATTAIDQLSIVENVVGVLDLLQKNGNYQATQDEEIQEAKWYFARSGTSPNYVYSVVNNPTSVYHLTEDTAIESGKTYYERTGTGTAEDPYVYTEVVNPVVADIGTYYEKYYELVGVDQAIQNYVSSHLAIDDEGLWLQNGTDANATRVLLSSTQGIKLFNGPTMIAQYGATSQIGDESGFHIKITGNELGFFNGGGVRIAYLNGQQLYITKSVVLQQMDLGTPCGYVDPVTGETGLGQWSWKVHPNGETPSRNNLNLKWVG